MTETQWDKLLKIKTTGRDDSRSNYFNYPYEPTPYEVLERLAGSGYISRKNVLLDYGCGKGRVCYYLSWQCRCRCVGVEYDDRIFKAMVKNKKTAVSAFLVEPVHSKAERYDLPELVDRVFFFNPFSVEILQGIMEKILDSWYDKPREILLFFYYPSDEYVAWLMSVHELMFLDEIDCSDLFQSDSRRERIMVFVISGVSQLLSG